MAESPWLTASQLQISSTIYVGAPAPEANKLSMTGSQIYPGRTSHSITHAILEGHTSLVYPVACAKNSVTPFPLSALRGPFRTYLLTQTQSGTRLGALPSLPSSCLCLAQMTSSTLCTTASFHRCLSLAQVGGLGSGTCGVLRGYAAGTR